MSTLENTNEPTAPVPPAFTLASRDKPFIGPNRPAAADLVGPETPTADQGYRQREQDHADWMKDMEHRKQRSAELAEKRRQHEANAKREVDVVSELDSALEALENGALDFDNSHLKPNLPLIEARNEVERLRSELAAAEDRLEEIEARGDSVQRLQTSVAYAEAALNGLLSTAEEQALSKLIVDRFGWDAPRHKIQRETLRELALDISVQSLREFVIQPQRGTTNDITALQQRLDVVGRQLVALREHLAQDQRDTINTRQ